MREILLPFLDREDPLEKGKVTLLQYSWASLVAQLVKNPAAMQETWVQSLGWEDPLEKGNGYSLQYCGLENFMDYIVHGVAKNRTQLSDFRIYSSSVADLNIPKQYSKCTLCQL